MGMFSDNFGGPEFGIVSKGETLGKNELQNGSHCSRALMLLPKIGCSSSNPVMKTTTTTSEMNKSVLDLGGGIPKTLDELFQDYGIREGVASRLTEIGFCANTLLSMSDEELEEAINTMCEERQVDLLLGERFGIKMACRAGRQLLEVQKRASASASAIALVGPSTSSPFRHGDHGWGGGADIGIEASQHHHNHHQHHHHQQQQQQQQQQDSSLLGKLLAEVVRGGRGGMEEASGRGLVQTQSAGSSDVRATETKTELDVKPPPLVQLLGNAITTNPLSVTGFQEEGGSHNHHLQHNSNNTNVAVHVNGSEGWNSKWARQHINALIEEMVSEYLNENTCHGEVLDVRTVMAECDESGLFRDNPVLLEAAVILGDVRADTRLLKASVVSRAVIRLASAGEVSLMGKDPEIWASLPLHKQTFSRVAEKGGSFSSLAEENGNLGLDLNLSLDSKLYNDSGNSRGVKRKGSSSNEAFDICDVEEDFSSDTHGGGIEERHQAAARFPVPDLDRPLRTGDGAGADELNLKITVRGEEAGPSWCSIDHLFRMYEDVICAHKELQGLTGKQQGLEKVNSEVVAFARRAGLCSVRCGTLLRYLHCFALHILYPERSDAMRAMSKARGEGVRQWTSSCCKALLAVAGHWGWDMRRLFEADPKLRHWAVPRKLLLLCALQKAKQSSTDPKLERRRQQGRIRQARYAAKKRAEAKKLQGENPETGEGGTEGKGTGGEGGGGGSGGGGVDGGGGGSSGSMPSCGPLTVFMGPAPCAATKHPPRPTELAIPRTPSVEMLFGTVSSTFSPVAGSSSAGPRPRAKRGGETSAPASWSRPRHFSPRSFRFDALDLKTTTSGLLAGLDDAELLRENGEDTLGHQLFACRPKSGGRPTLSSGRGGEALDPRTERRRAQGRLRQARYAAKKRAASAMALMAGGGAGGGAGGSVGSTDVGSAGAEGGSNGSG